MGRLFGTDGIRGVANVDLTPVLAYDLGRAVGHHLEAVERPERLCERARVREVRGSPVEALVEGRLDRDDERVHGHEVAAVPPLPDARLGHEVGVSRERRPGHRPEPFVERDVDAVEEARDLRV